MALKPVFSAPSGTEEPVVPESEHPYERGTRVMPGEQRGGGRWRRDVPDDGNSTDASARTG